MSTGSTWFRVDTACPFAPAVSRLAAALGISRAQALGHIVAVEAHVTAHAPSGDLSPVLDMLPVWALWTGNPDDFTDAFLRHCAPDGVMSEWVERNAGPMAHAQRERERLRAYRRRKGSRGAAERVPDASDEALPF